MKIYQKPDIELIKFSSETVTDGTDIGDNIGGNTSNIIPNDPGGFASL